MYLEQYYTLVIKLYVSFSIISIHVEVVGLLEGEG